MFCLHPQISGPDDLFKKPMAPLKKDEKSKVGNFIQQMLHYNPYLVSDSLRLPSSE